jgi:hypothetical protein
VVLAGLNVAVTPDGKPDAVKATGLLNPFNSVTVMVLDPLAPPSTRVKAEIDEARLKLGAETAT